MFNRYRTQAVLLAAQNSGESNKIFTIYTQQFGKINIFAKSIRKKESKLRFGINFFLISEIELIKGRKYRTLTDVKIIENFGSIKKDLLASSLAFKALNDVNLLTKEEVVDEKIWLLLIVFLREINKKEKDSLFTYFHFIWKLFSFLGYKPRFNNCVFCSRKVSLNLFFSSSGGGIVGDCCSKKASDLKDISEKEVKLLNFFSKSNLEFKDLKINSNTQNKLKEIVNDYFRYLSLK